MSTGKISIMSTTKIMANSETIKRAKLKAMTGTTAI